MRLKFYPALGALTLAGLSLLSISVTARAQEQTEVLMPEQSAAKAKESDSESRASARRHGISGRARRHLRRAAKVLSATAAS